MHSKIIRVFLSSTFKDMKSERDALHGEKVAGRLRKLCEEAGFQFQLIDLRWGVSEEASYDQRAEELCLEEIRRCQQVTPRPNFVALLGQRYGWCPLPVTLKPDDFWKLREAASNNGLVGLLDNWYRHDANNIPPVYRLRPRGSETEKDPAFWGPEVETPLLEHIQACLADSDWRKLLSNDLAKEAGKSLTEKEIELGAENAQQADWAAFAYIRHFRGLSQKEIPEPYVDHSNNQGKVALSKLNRLKARLESNSSVVVRAHEANLSENGVDDQYLDSICQTIYEDLEGSIKKQIEEFENQDRLEREKSNHYVFSKNRQLNYVPRPDEEGDCASYIHSKSEEPLILAGASGLGKTALCATVGQKVQDWLPNAITVVRFVGATGDSVRLPSLIHSVYEEVVRAKGYFPEPQQESEDPGFWLARALDFATPEEPVVVILDALDQLSGEGNALSAQWVPRKIPEESRLICSCMRPSNSSPSGPTTVYESLKGRLGQKNLKTLAEPTGEEAAKMFTAWLGHYGRRVTERQMGRVKEAAFQCPRPLFLRLMAEIARTWRAEDEVGPLPTTIPDSVSAYLERLEDPANHNKVLVSRTLGWLAQSRGGLSEPELVSLMEKDVGVQEWLESTQHEAYPEGGTKIPPAVWSRLFFDLGPFLHETIVVGTQLVGFYHRQLAEAAHQRYLTDEFYKSCFNDLLVDYFEEQPAWLSVAKGLPNIRRAYELPYQLLFSERRGARDRLRGFLCDIESTGAKLKSGLKRDLVYDYSAAAKKYPEESDTFVEFLRDQLFEENSWLAQYLQPGDLHSFLAYQGDPEAWQFYRNLLEAMSEIQLPARSSQHARHLQARARIDFAGLVRREGDLERPRELLDFIQAEDADLSLADRATGWYELGYVEYLEGRYESAETRFRRSVQDGKAGGDEVGAAISRTLELWNSYFANPTENQLRQVCDGLREVAPIFAEESRRDPRAVRWVMNASAHLATCAYLRGSAEELESRVKELASDPWIREFGDPGALSEFQARLAHLKGDYAEAVGIWEQNLRFEKGWRDKQNMAWRLLDYGLALYGCGAPSAATKVFYQGLAQPGNRGNVFWQTRIRAALREIPLSRRWLGSLWHYLSGGGSAGFFARAKDRMRLSLGGSSTL